ncbi:hypothetical protein ABRY18_05855 [Clostridioides difficile]
MPPAPTYICNRTVKKRRGYYSERDVFLSPCPYVSDEGSMYETTYYGEFDLSSYKIITVPTSTKREKTATRVYFISGGSMITSSSGMKQVITLELIPDPNIIINEDLGVISDSCNISYRIPDSNTSVKFDVTEKLNDVVISKKNYALDGNYTLSLTDEHLSTLSFNSKNNITIELSTYQGGKFLEKTVTFIKGNTKPKLNISSYNSTSATFTAIDTDNNLSKIEWYLDDVLKNTFTTDLTTEKIINYELTDNAIHTLKIVATDAENATAEKVLSISKEIMPLQTDSTLQDISNKLVEIGEGFRNGKTSIINTLALKNIDASLNNTLVELSEKIKTSFDSSDASVEELQNRITELTNQLSQRIKYATGTYTPPDGSQNSLVVPTNLNFVPKTILIMSFGLSDGSNPAKFLSCGISINSAGTNIKYNNGSYTRIIGSASIRDITADSFKIEIGKGDMNAGVDFPFKFNKFSFRWYALDIEFLYN